MYVCSLFLYLYMASWNTLKPYVLDTVWPQMRALVLFQICKVFDPGTNGPWASHVANKRRGQLGSGTKHFTNQPEHGWCFYGKTLRNIKHIPLKNVTRFSLDLEGGAIFIASHYLYLVHESACAASTKIEQKWVINVLFGITVSVYPCIPRSEARHFNNPVERVYRCASMCHDELCYAYVLMTMTLTMMIRWWRGRRRRRWWWWYLPSWV